MNIKTIAYGLKVDLDESREVWNNNHGVALWASKGNLHIWLETNGDPVVCEDALRVALAAEGWSNARIRAALDGVEWAFKSEPSTCRAELTPALVERLIADPDVRAAIARRANLT